MFDDKLGRLKLFRQKYFFTKTLQFNIANINFRTVIIDTDEVDTYSINEIDERVIQARLEAEILEATTQELLLQEYPSDCCPETYYIRFPCLVGDPDSPFWQGWGNLRIKTFRLIENKYFETAVIAMILISSLALVRKPMVVLF